MSIAFHPGVVSRPGRLSSAPAVACGTARHPEARQALFDEARGLRVVRRAHHPENQLAPLRGATRRLGWVVAEGGATGPDSRTRCAIYPRISRPDEQAILDNQARDLCALAAKHGYTITREYVEIASGADDGRAQLSALRHDSTLRRRPWEVLLFRWLSRLTRTGPYGAHGLLRQFQASGVGRRILESPTVRLPLDRDRSIGHVRAGLCDSRSLRAEPLEEL